MQCITGELENDMEVEGAKAGTGEYWWSGKEKYIKMELLVNPGLKNVKGVEKHPDYLKTYHQPHHRADH